MAKDEHREPADYDSTSESSHAADEPTAVWDIEALRKAGLGELANLPEGPDAGPATPAEGVPRRPSIIVDADKDAPVAAAPKDAPAQPAPAQPAPAQSAPAPTSASWVGLLVMALVLAAATYFAIRALR